ncbi:hypothetical protein JOS77_27730 [Chromobacterium haemolyticum]|nr:hypothetical protein JOS77_27730 [Chromobacterium haemolyticum]
MDAAQTPAAYERNRRVDVLWKVADAAKGAQAQPSVPQAQSPLALAPGVGIGNGPSPLEPGYKEQQP